MCTSTDRPSLARCRDQSNRTEGGVTCRFLEMDCFTENRSRLPYTCTSLSSGRSSIRRARRRSFVRVAPVRGDEIQAWHSASETTLIRRRLAASTPNNPIEVYTRVSKRATLTQGCSDVNRMLQTPPVLPLNHSDRPNHSFRTGATIQQQHRSLAGRGYGAVVEDGVEKIKPITESWSWFCSNMPSDVSHLQSA